MNKDSTVGHGASEGASGNETSEPVILLVEDNPADVMAVKQAFSDLAQKVRLSIVTDGQAAMQYLSGAKPFSNRQLHPIPRLILLDLKLPIFDGFHVLEWIRTEPFLKNIPVIILTTTNATEQIQRAYAFGASSFITKPSTLKKLAADLELALNHWLGKAHLRSDSDLEERQAA